MTPHSIKPDMNRDATRMWFKDDFAKYNGEYHLYGGVCWPKTVYDTGTATVRGHVVLMGMNTDTRHHYLFSEAPFVSIDHVVHGDQFKHRGVAQWFADVERGFGPLATYWWGDQEDAVFNRNYRLLGQSQLKDQSTGLRFGRALFSQGGDPLHAFLERRQRGVIHAPRDSRAAQEADERAAHLGEDLPPALHALLCAVAGDERFPWQDLKINPAPPELLVRMM